MTPLLLSLLLAPDGAPTDWRELVQKPYAGLPVADVGLRPLLVTPDGKRITTPAEWEKARRRLHDGWMKHLGQPPARPANLGGRVEKTEDLDGYRRQLVSFVTEDDDRLRAYLLTPAGLKEGEKRPAVVVFHPKTTRKIDGLLSIGLDWD
jgi:hypothetical protein